MLFLLALLSCKKEQAEPIPVKQYLSVEVKGRGYIEKFTVNGSDASSPAPVYKGDQVYINIVTMDIRATINYKITLDGKVLQEKVNSRGTTFNLQIP